MHLAQKYSYMLELLAWLQNLNTWPLSMILPSVLLNPKTLWHIPSRRAWFHEYQFGLAVVSVKCFVNWRSYHRLYLVTIFYEYSQPKCFDWWISIIKKTLVFFSAEDGHCVPKSHPVYCKFNPLGDWASNPKLWTLSSKDETFSQKTLSQVDCSLLKWIDKPFDWPHGLSVITFARNLRMTTIWKSTQSFGILFVMPLALCNSTG